MSSEYKKAGVDIEAGDSLVRKIRPAIEATHNKHVKGDFGHYGALYALDALGAPDTLLVSGTDGVGTKLELTKETGYWDRIGQDLVAMCANDILCLGAQPLFFLDYYATGELDVDQTAQIIQGIATACRFVSCALIGGETAEMPGIYRPGDFDMAGFIVGWVKADQVIDGKNIKVGDRIYGLPSSGFHSNGYSLVRAIIREQNLNLEDNLPNTTESLGDWLTRPTRLYGPMLKDLLNKPELHGLAHITGGGLLGNLPRILPNDCQIQLDRSQWERPAIFNFFETIHNLSAEEMVTVFNDGIGMVLIVDPAAATEIVQYFSDMDETLWDLGSVEARQDPETAVILK